MGLLGKLFALRRAEPPCENTLRELMENDFNVMFLPLFHLWEGEEDFTLKIPYGDDCRSRREPCGCRGVDTRAYRQRMREGCCVLLGVAELGSFLFTDHRHSDLFRGVQRAFKNVRSFVFCGNETGGYFKILENGRIRRKIASHLVMEGIGNNPETRGEPCEYECETGHVYRIDSKAEWMKDMLPDFGKREVWALFDYYVGWERFRTEDIQAVRIYRLETARGREEDKDL